MGYASTIEDESIDDMLKRADPAMYKQKNDYYAYLRAENNNNGELNWKSTRFSTVITISKDKLGACLFS